jgi:hypothetical protein
MVKSLTGFGPKNDCAGEEQHQLQRQIRSLVRRNSELCDSNKNLVACPRRVLDTKTGRLTVGLNIKLTLTLIFHKRQTYPSLRKDFTQGL